MKKSEKIALIQKGIEETTLCRCYFTYDQNYFYYYPNAVNDKFMLGQEEDDFILDGYCIRKISHIKKVEIKDDKCHEINKMFGVTNQVVDPGIDISSWRSIFESLSKLDTYIQIEDEFNEQFVIGVIEKVLKDRLYFKPFDADGVWDEDGLEIRYSQITSVSWGTRYAQYWKRYLEREYITEQFGEYTEVFHEMVSPDIHLDIIIVPPTEKSNYYKLITMGMGAYPMNIPRELKKYELERAELVLYLPATWNVKSEREEDYWPIRQLKALGRIPIQYDTWLGFGHTISSDRDNTPYADNTNFCSMLLLNALNQNYEELDLRMESIGKINFYQLFPLYKEELEFKQEHDAETLLELFSDEDIMPVVNSNRKNYGICK